MSKRRQREFLVVVALMLLNSLAEMITLGAVMPFLAVISEPERIWAMTKVQVLGDWMGWTGPSDLLWPACLTFAGAALLAGVVRLVTLGASIALANGIGGDMSIEIYRRTLYQPYGVHMKRNSSEVISAVATEVDQSVIMLIGVQQMLSAILLSLGLGAVLIFVSPGLSLVLSLVIGGVYGMLMYRSRLVLQRLGTSIVKDQKQRIRSLQEGLGAIRDVIINGTQPIYTRVYGQADRQLRRHRGVGHFIALAPRYGIEAIGLVAFSIAVLVIAIAQSNFLGVLPLMGAMALGAQRILPALQVIYASSSSFRLNLPALNSVLGYLNQPIAREDLAPRSPALALERKLELRGVSFRYGSELPWVLSNVNLSICQGQRLGIVGQTGGGKSTLVDILIGLLEPTMGELLVDGQTVRGERLRRWRRCIAHVPQTIYLSDASIAENIAFGIPVHEIDTERLKRAAKQAQIAEFIEELELDYATPVGERGIQLSGGQRQRIGIARALYREAPVLVFDEATSALDNSTESELMEAVNSLSKDITVVMIAHRVSTLKICDRVISVSQGHVEDT